MSEISKLHEYIKDTNDDIETPSPGTLFYLKTFKAYEGLPRFASWNWMAFIFGPYWLVYRKMYLYTFFHFLLFVVFLPYGGLAANILLGTFGNALYQLDIEKRIANNKNRRGTSILAMVMLTCLIATAMIITALMAPHRLARLAEMF